MPSSPTAYVIRARGGREACEMSGCYRNVTKRVERIEPLDLSCLVWIYRLEARSAIAVVSEASGVGVASA